MFVSVALYCSPLDDLSCDVPCEPLPAFSPVSLPVVSSSETASKTLSTTGCSVPGTVTGSTSLGLDASVTWLVSGSCTSTTSLGPSSLPCWMASSARSGFELPPRASSLSTAPSRNSPDKGASSSRDWRARVVSAACKNHRWKAVSKL